MSVYILVMVGGAIGTLVRYGVFLLSPDFVNTWLVNIIGCFIFGYFSSKKLSDSLKAFLLTGFCGSFTTMSALMGDVFYWFESSQYAYLFGWVLFHMAFGLLAVITGRVIGRRVVK